jgi:hypothetical protein
MILNRAAREISLPFPEELRVHDWWITMQTAAKGKVDHIATPTLLYRQHKQNLIGAKRKALSSLSPGAHCRRIVAHYRTVQRIRPQIQPFTFVAKLLFVTISTRLRQAIKRM